jgi:glycerol-3-phosphate dehydrogenase (NAD(P)+)
MAVSAVKKSSNNNSSIVIGSGSWGSAIAKLLFKNGHSVSILSKKKDHPLTSIKIKVVDRLIDGYDFIFIAVPSDAVMLTLKSLAKEKISTLSKIIICSKGIDGESLQLFSECLFQELPKNKYAIMSGPNFASEVFESLPTVTTVASTDKKVALDIVNLLKNDNFLPIISSDVVATQILGSIKNILAIGCGIVDGLNLGENAKAALILKGSLEAGLLIKALGGKSPEKSFMSPCGLGDLFLTCSSKKSRNNHFGYMVGSGKKINEIIKSGDTFEGFKASDLMIKFSKKYHVTLPLCEKINYILHQNFTTKEIREIISKVILSN